VSLLLLFGGGSGGATPVGSGVTGPGGTTLFIEFSPTTNPLDTPVWVDISTSVRHAEGVTIRRGRSSELDAFQTGTASFTLDNRTRLFDPTNAAGTYYGNLKPLRRFRILATYNSVTYPLFVGFCQGWPQEYDVSNREAVCPIQLVDGFGLLAQTNGGDNAFVLDSATEGILDSDRLGGEGGDIAVELSGERVVRVLDINGWPEADRAVDDGLSLVSSDFPSGSGLAYLQQVERSEDGFLYVSADGQVVFLDRNNRQTLTRMSTSQATFDDDGTDLAYSGLSYQFDAENLYNDIRLTGDSGTEQADEDPDSIDAYFRRTFSDTILTTPDDVVRDLVQLKLLRYKDPLLRCPQIEVKPLADRTNLFPAVLGRELLDRVTVRRTPQGVGSVNATEQIVEGVAHTFTSKNWVTTLQLSPGFITSFFTLDSVTLGVLDEDLLGA
jgi:hypothetical protein